MSGFITTHAGPRAAVTVSLGTSDPQGGLGTPDVFFQARSGDVLAGYGVAARLTARNSSEWPRVAEAIVRLPEQLEGPPPPAVWLGGFAFDPDAPRDERWASFGAADWIVPARLVWSRGGEFFLTTFGSATGDLAIARGFTGDVQEFSSREAWFRGVETATRWFREKQGIKVVLARPIDLQASGAFDLGRVLERMRRQHLGSTVFLLRSSDGAAFLGASPETLFSKRGSQVDTEALAGTSVAGEESTLLTSERIRREHLAVVEGIRTASAPLATEFQAEPEPRVVSFRNLRHLRTGISFQLRAETSLSELIRALHPTPAVGGTPRARAMEFIRVHEGMDRGFYAGPVGWVAGENAEFSVALRSAWVHGARARMFVGAGLVEGCDAEAEWRETEAKSRPMREALMGGES